jgi:peptidoglycan-N-acetylglucosamine deacetylase
VVFLQLPASLIAPVVDLSALGALFSLLPYRGLAFAFHGMQVRLLVAYLAFLGVDLASALVAFALEGEEKWSLLLWLPLQRALYRVLFSWVTMRAVVAALRGRFVGWGKLERHGSVPEQP